MQTNTKTQIQSFFYLLIPLFCSLSTTYAQLKTFSPEEVKADMVFLKKKFEQIHPGMYHYYSQKNYEKVYDSLYNSISKPMSHLEAYKHFAPLVTMVKDGHTNIFYGNKYYTKTTKYLPFYIRKLENGYFLSLNMSGDSTILRGSEVKSVNDEAIEKVFEKIKFSVSVDNDNEISRMHYVTGGLPNYYLRTFGEIDSVKVTYKLPDSTHWITKKFACLTNIEAEKNALKRYKKIFERPNLKLKIVDSVNKIAILDITSFSLKGGKLDIPQFKFKRALKQRFESIQKNKIDYLIIDFRGNGGGFVPNIARLMKYLSPKPFNLLESYGFKKTAYFTIAPIYSIIPPLLNWAIFNKKDSLYRFKDKFLFNYKPNESLGYRGKTYFVIDPGCYSATTFTLALAKDLGVGEAFVGQQVGGASWGSFAGNWKDFKLLNTKFTIHTPMYKLQHKLNNKPENFFLQPTYEVGRSYEELRKNNSNSLDFTVKMIQRSLEISRK